MLKRTSKQLSMFSSLEDMLSHQHPLFQLSNKINWECFENAFSPLYCSNNGRPAHPIRLMCGLLILKHLRNVSDEMVVSQWSENAYYQKIISWVHRYYGTNEKQNKWNKEIPTPCIPWYVGTMNRLPTVGVRGCKRWCTWVNITCSWNKHWLHINNSSVHSVGVGDRFIAPVRTE